MLCNHHRNLMILRKATIPTIVSHVEKSTKSSETCSNKPPCYRNHDWIGPINKLSNIRFIDYKKPENESKVERAYRQMKEDNLMWNHLFWEEQNKCFIKAKEQFTAQTLKLKGSDIINADGTKNVLTADEMAQFYRLFLEEQKERMTKYNKDWYQRNMATIVPGFRVFLYNVRKKLFG